jgi:DNA-binding transcriptional LysR family regulator
MRPFNWDDLRYFVAVAQAGTVSQAARSLAVDHATVIRRVEALERALGVKLFERNPRGYNLTLTGEQLMVSAEIIHEETRKVMREARSGGHAVGGLVRVSTLEGFGNFFLASRLPKFTTEYPNLAVELLTLQQIVALSRREADVAISLQPPESGRFSQEKLTDYLLYVYGSKQYLAGRPPIRTREDLRLHAFCGYIDDLIFVRGLNYLSEVAPGVRARLQSSSLHAQAEAVSQGFGLCVLPAFIGSTRPELERVLADDVVLRRSYWLVANSDVATSPRVQAFSRFIKDQVQAARALFLPGEV